ncbi:hypothetical protein RO3G_02458 [Rhizopus delemar RA 99-880]|uniref:CCHC-type domain-containing protein n=1 Tax=Rhizopus delemar (strain RA 99-880 / ATCC MYA-4621 / FGSC 9543 / NRRL 43880) TaxID=246409 RepID=I1BNH4_RHIO9|nr:hypothetical protein RO3G_02458 [Rhizopus delemar RA 99-880]|eukprot:EIE77754.1 hypothetical protein RO3G_02458 [Rhizopus delemar RA 99-880]
MVLSDKEFLAPNKAILHTKPKKLSWVNVVHAGHQKTSSFLAMSTNNSTTQSHGVGIGQPDTNAEMSPSNLNAQASRPFLKGSVPNSIFVDITTVKDKKIFLTELTAFCQGNEHLWAVADQIRREYQRMYAELTVSPAMYERLCTEGLQLPSFTDRFLAFPSLSPSAELLKVTLTGLPHQYGRRDGGLAQLHSDMQRNLSSFGHIIDSGTVRGTSGFYSGKGYVVLEKFPESDQQRAETPRPELQHNVHWVYQPLAYSTSATPVSLLEDVSINVHATWSSMKPYCRYCHGDHPLKDCQVRQQATICYWCNESGHIAKYCDRKNVYEVSGAPNKKTRKTPIVSATEKPLINLPDSVTSLDKNLVVSNEANVETTSPLDVTPATVHSHRSLSFRGRVTILNSLILSKLWHVLRILSVPKRFFLKLQSQISGFVSAKQTPRISFETMCFPRNKGGLGVLNPPLQQSALQLRWLLPLLHDFPCSPTSDFWNHHSLKSSVVLPLLADFLLSHLLPTESREPIQTDYRQAFVFKQLRPRKLIQSLDGVFSLFFRAVDNLPHIFDKVVINPQTALCLTLGDVSVPSSSCPLPSSMARLLCSSVYMTDPISGRLRPRSAREISLHPYLTKRFLKWVRSDHMKLYPFFVRAFLRPSSSFIPVAHTHIDMSPFLVALSLTPKPGDQLRLTSKRYRRLCSPPVSSSTLYPDLPPSKWLLLWRFPLRAQSRNIWYRLIHNKLPCRSNLYLPSKLCPVCKNLEETPSHFLFDCPQKLAIWSLLWDSQFEQPFSKYSLRRALFLLDFPKCRPDTVHAPSVFISTILLAIWRNHWAFIFDHRPFLTDVTIRCVNQLLSVSLQESLLSSGISPLPLPHLQLSDLSSC